MQSRYVGDIGDFGKFGLLRALVSDSLLKLGVIWYLVPDSEADHNGQHIDYLRSTHDTLRRCDTELFEALRKIVSTGLEPFMRFKTSLYYRRILCSSMRPCPFQRKVDCQIG